tara:strand:+ start:36 stop:473 length:438 start_codon:yes stop_codon:yes gene_type:complete
MICNICLSNNVSNPIIRVCGCKNFICEDCKKIWKKCIYNCKNNTQTIHEPNFIDLIFEQILKKICYLKDFIDKFDLVNNNLILFIIISFTISFLIIFPIIILYSFLSNNIQLRFIKINFLIIIFPFIALFLANNVQNLINTSTPF